VAIASRCGGFDRFVSPPECEKITAFIDVGTTLLWYVVVGWSEGFDAHILDCGAWPEQRSRVFLARNASPTLLEAYKGGPDAALHAGLKELTGRLMGRDWQRSDGANLSVSRLMIDAGYATDLVRLFIRQSDHRERLVPSKGIGLGPGQTAIRDYVKRPGEKIGDGWILGIAGADRLRLLRFDSNLWKTRLADMLTRPMGTKGGVSLWGRKPVDHELLAIHCSSENPVQTEAKGNAVNIWTRRPDRENHLWDCLVGSCVAASLEGLSPLASLGGAVHVRPPKERKSMAEMQSAARNRPPL
jgi:phage terminase large subunit GpA-like protein